MPIFNLNCVLLHNYIYFAWQRKGKENIGGEILSLSTN